MNGDTALRTEVQLGEDIQFPHSVSKNSTDPKAVFLTGATGFFGVYLLNELLRTTDADIYCLIRCNKGDESAGQRLEDHLRFYSFWQDEFASRIIPVQGDLAQPLLGLSPRQFQDLGEQLDVIYHNGAWVNSIYPYSFLKKTNVDGTREALRLAAVGRTKPFHFTSTVAVFYSNFYNGLDRKIMETDLPESTLKGGYKQSKQAAEQLVIQARERGLSASIYRTARIMGHSKTGVNGNLNDFLIRMMQACITLGKFPDRETLLYLVPADYASQALVYLSQQKSPGKEFHILNPSPVTWNTFFEKIGELGYSLEKISQKEWLEEVRNYVDKNRKSKLYTILRFALNSSKAMVHTKPKFDMSGTLRGLVDTGIDCPPVDKKLVATWVEYLQKCRYLSMP